MPSLFQQIQSGMVWDFHGGVHPPSRKQQTNQKPVAVMPLSSSQKLVTVEVGQGEERVWLEAACAPLDRTHAALAA
mgnify:CR=1 FL=1